MLEIHFTYSNKIISGNITATDKIFVSPFLNLNVMILGGEAFGS
jgi:hypothetical protein